MVAGLVLVLGGCSASAVIESIDGHETILITYPSSEGESTEQGELVEVGRCVGIDLGTGPVLVLFQPGTHITQDKEVLLESGEKFALGTDVVMTGTLVKSSSIGGQDRLPEGCLSHDAFLAQEIKDP